MSKDGTSLCDWSYPDSVAIACNIWRACTLERTDSTAYTLYNVLSIKTLVDLLVILFSMTGVLSVDIAIRTDMLVCDKNVIKTTDTVCIVVYKLYVSHIFQIWFSFLLGFPAWGEGLVYHSLIDII